jgi:dienelactone hydrolase
MRLILGAVILAFSANANAFFWNKEDLSLKEETIQFWQPSTNENFQIPERPYDIWHYERNMLGSGLNFFSRNIPTYDKKGTLFASWTPANNSTSPTIIIVHGGHGVTPGELQAGMWFKKNLNANVLILDSFWSRGIFQNHETTNQHGVDMRVLDVLAARKWLESQPLVNQNFVYVYGGSQGGWTALRLMTDDPFIKQSVGNKIRAAFSLYPFCREAPKFGGKHSTHVNTNLSSEPWHAPNLGPYFGKVYVFTGGRDEPTDPNQCNQSVFTQATEWHHYPEGTHSWDLANRGTNPPVDGECARAKNPLLRFQMCRNDKITYDVLGRIKGIIEKDVNNR